VLGANDGIVSTASLLMGVAAADTSKAAVILAGVSGLIAGAMSMAAGEYVSVSSQLDSQSADLDRERRELDENPEFERAELAQIYVSRGLDESLAEKVAGQLMAHDSLGAHARDELGLTELQTARPIQAALTSAATFSIGAVLPLIAALLAPLAYTLPIVAGSSLLFLACLGSVAAMAGGAPVWVSTLRVVLWGALAMGATTLVGTWFGVAF
jgi:VIT1/CCC1 family predicted Fe2+/Mn2+ transporter